ncbi:MULTISPECIES: hypothetical protein [Phyllobacterium]|jgi:hypothetical protein|uniref:Pilus assembly protein CpaD n=1 Tax=Phyllobacterium sophorae TaxID=1520277 RepID=A0A2P7BII4_9HYPH|nr:MULTISPECIES: hypothetical protein [Phyllobacterium]PSH66228.1 hypothetical protein CU103_06545 [Phyllobacterium sophorae]UXN64204.1 hypothetical protein N8E89_17610 [Phyllobacterium sp. A18/5-2]
MKLFLRLTAPLLMIAMSGCAGINYAKSNYGGLPQQQFTASSGQSFQIIDNPARGRMMIGPGTGGSATEGFVRGLGMGVANSLVATPPVVYRDAAEQYLRSSGRNCTAQDVTAIMDPRYEVRYRCMGGRTNQDRMLGPA